MGVTAPSGLPDLNGRAAHDSSLVYEWSPRFGGKEEDIEVGLSYFGARYYSPFLGAWMSPDPVTIHELSSDTNPYAYVYGSPLMGVDPDGRFAFSSGSLSNSR